MKIVLVDPDTDSDAFLCFFSPGIRIRESGAKKTPDPRSGMNIPDQI
jgi:hypothetical protein